MSLGTPRVIRASPLLASLALLKRLWRLNIRNRSRSTTAHPNFRAESSAAQVVERSGYVGLSSGWEIPRYGNNNDSFPPGMTHPTDSRPGSSSYGTNAYSVGRRAKARLESPYELWTQSRLHQFRDPFGSARLNVASFTRRRIRSDLARGYVTPRTRLPAYPHFKGLQDHLYRSLVAAKYRSGSSTDLDSPLEAPCGA